MSRKMLDTAGIMKTYLKSVSVLGYLLKERDDQTEMNPVESRQRWSVGCGS